MGSFNNIILVVGQRGSGKTTVSLEIANRSQKSLIVIAGDQQSAYSDFAPIRSENIRWFKGKGYLSCKNPEEAGTLAKILRENYANAFIIFEDCQKFISPVVQRSIMELIINCRHNNFDIVFMYHHLRFVPPFISQNWNILFLFKTTDGKKPLYDKYANWDRICISRERIMKNPNKHYYEAIYDNEN